MKDTEFAKEVEAVIKRGRREENRLNTMLNLKVFDCSKEEKYVEYEADIKEWQRNPYGGVHGGATCAIFDTGMGTGAVAFSRRMVTTTDLTISYLSPMNSDRYIFHLDYTKIGRTMVRVMGKAIDPKNGKICATAMGSFALLEETFEPFHIS